MLFQPNTSSQITKFLHNPSHGLLLAGPEGSGKMHTAIYIAAELLDQPVDSTQSYPYFTIISSIDQTIGIDQIRELQKFLHLKTLGDQRIRRIAVIVDAHLMTQEAQNALLKSLEEPPSDTVLILTATKDSRLKNTVLSRVQQITISPIEYSAAHEYYKNTVDESVIKKAYLMSGGRIGLMHALLYDQEHRFATEIIHAKQILAASRFDRLTRIDEFANNKERIPTFLQACKLICSTALEQTAKSDNLVQTKRWHSALDAILKAESSLSVNPSIKLLMTDLMLRI